MPLNTGTRLGPYEIVALLGAGGMGEVYKARDERLGRDVALKVLSARLTQDAAAVDRFTREARAASALNHPHIVTIHDIGEVEAGQFIVMELVEGRTLRALMVERPAVDMVVRVGEQIARALAAAHAAGIVHRDIKPENVMLRDDGYVKVLDFGLARLLPEGVAASAVATAFATEAGALLGTLRYMAPEQARGEPATTAADIFALGLVLYESATGRHPFAGDSNIAIVHAILSESPLLPSRLERHLPAALDALILQMLDKDPRLRPAAADVEATLAAIASARSAASTLPPVLPARSTTRRTVGRAKERGELGAGFDRAATGHGGLLTVAGEPGIGKTTLVEEFLDDLTSSGQSCLVARGRCSERLAGTEAYLPWLEALESLLHGEMAESVSRAMKTLAPSWYVQVAPLASDDSSAARLAAEAQAGSQERRKRELAAFLQETSRLRPLVLSFDDLHWADVSTVDLLSYLAAKLTTLRILAVATYRQSDLLLSKHPFLPVKLDLEARGVCRELRLEFLTVEDVERYLALEFPGHAFSADFPAFIHAKTEGSPLFMVDLLRYLRDRQVIVQAERGVGARAQQDREGGTPDVISGRWILAQPLAVIEHEVPASVSSMIHRKMDQLGDADRRLLVAASVQGYEFDAAIVAEALTLDPADVEERLDGLERMHGFVRRVREEELPDRTLTLRCRFVHVLYQNALYASLTPARRASLSTAIARALVAHYGEEAGTIAAQLAVLFEAARDFTPAAQYFRLAAEQAGRMQAYVEAIVLARRGLPLLDAVPESLDRARQELALQATLGPALMATKGIAASEVEVTFLRARELCAQVGETDRLLPVLGGLCAFHIGHAEWERAEKLGNEVLAVAEHQHDPALLLLAHSVLGVPCLCLGQFSRARAHFEQGIALYDPRQHSSHTFLFGMDPGVQCLSHAGLALWFLGYPDQALRRMGEALSLAQELSRPYTVAAALYFTAALHVWRREAEVGQERAREVVTLSTDQGFPFWAAWGTIWAGAAAVQAGQHREGIVQIEQGMVACRAIGAEMGIGWSYCLGVLAEAYGKAGRKQEALALLTEALARVRKTLERFWDAELHRVRGELLLSLAGTQAAEGSVYRGTDRRQKAVGRGQEAVERNRKARRDRLPRDSVWEAEESFREALDIARHQQAKSLELRAVTSLSRLLAQSGRNAEARQMLAEIYSWFTEGFETQDLQEARTLLDELS